MARPRCWRTQDCSPSACYKVKEGRPNVVDLIKGDRIQLIVNTPHGQDTFFDEKAIRRAAVLARIPTITTLAAARAAAEGIAALQEGVISVIALQTLHADRFSCGESVAGLNGVAELQFRVRGQLAPIE